MSAVWAVLAGAVLCWPRPAAVARLGTVRARAGLPAGPRRLLRDVRTRGWPPGTGARVPTWAPAAVTVGLGAALAGPGGALAAALLGATLLRVRRATRADRERGAAAGGLADALSSFAAEVRAGAPAAAAAESAGTDSHAVAERALARVAATARLGGDVPAALRALAGTPELPGREHLDRLAGAWSLADRHGVGLALPVEAVATDLRARARLAGRLEAQLAGPRATATVLAALPVLGILLGEGIGARPWSVLTTSVLGQGLLVVGVGLVCAGVLWTARITAGVAR